jgi:hypothetical protein
MASKPTHIGPCTLSYLKYLQAKQKQHALADIGAEETELLNAMALHWSAGKPLAVREAMELKSLASPSTLHRRIANLKTLGWIADQNRSGNLRIKLLVPTAKALAYFDKMGRALASAV